jgi:excisionase family DNA binding protein
LEGAGSDCYETEKRGEDYQAWLKRWEAKGTGAMKTPKKKAMKAPAIGERLLTLREAAEVLHLNPRTVREYVSRGEIEGRIIGGRWRFRRADLDAFFENAPRGWDFV